MPSERLRKYIEADKKVKESEQERDEYKKYVQLLLKRAKALGVKVKNVTFTEQERFTLNEEKILQWLSTVLDEERLTYVTKKIVDLEKLNELYLSGIVDPTQMPETCYSKISYPVIRIKHK